MHDLPHHYTATAAGSPEGDISLTSPRVPTLLTAAPAEFGGPGDKWSPETLLAGAVADCLILTFRAVARASKLAWNSIVCDVEGTLDRVERATQFTAFTMRVTLTVPPSVEIEAARRAVERAEHGCLITNSLKAPVTLETMVLVSAATSS